VIENPSEGDVTALRRILSAGGQRLVATAAARSGLDPERLESGSL
jgi:hypothetical protein